MTIYFIASVQSSHLEEIHSLAKRLEAKGCRITRVTQILGIITGSVEDDHSIDDLRIDGIDQIEVDRKIKPI